MKKQVVFLAWILSIQGCLYAQPEHPKNYRNFPLVVSIQFHNLSLPFKDIKSNFSNIGLGLGTEWSLNGRHNWAQQINLVWLRNKAVGSGLFFYSQSAWRPAIASDFYTEIKIGAGYFYAFRPVKSFRQENGVWKPVGHKGKGMLAIPIGLSAGLNPFSQNTYISPFAGYQFLVLSGYNKSIPIIPETLIQIGSSIHFNQ